MAKAPIDLTCDGGVETARTERKLVWVEVDGRLVQRPKWMVVGQSVDPPPSKGQPFTPSVGYATELIRRMPVGDQRQVLAWLQLRFG